MKRLVGFSVLLTAMFSMGLQANEKTTPASERLVPKLHQFVARVSKQDPVAAARQLDLKNMAEIVARQLISGKQVDLLFVCTHNSRRSQMCQLWAQAAAHYYGVAGLKTHSGGTESTAFNHRAVAAMRRAGFSIKTKRVGENPRYEVAFATDAKPIEAFSKVYTDRPNPQKDFVAIMVCGDADEKCPVVAGSSARMALHFVDPKVSDETSGETKTYDERCSQIAKEMLFVMSHTKRLLKASNEPPKPAK
jgi:arsenate reductase (thioredoxin)